MQPDNPPTRAAAAPETAAPTPDLAAVGDFVAAPAERTSRVTVSSATLSGSAPGGSAPDPMGMLRESIPVGPDRVAGPTALERPAPAPARNYVTGTSAGPESGSSGV